VIGLLGLLFVNGHELPKGQRLTGFLSDLNCVVAEGRVHSELACHIGTFSSPSTRDSND